MVADFVFRGYDGIMPARLSHEWSRTFDLDEVQIIIRPLDLAFLKWSLDDMHVKMKRT